MKPENVPFLDSANADYIAQLLTRYAQDPDSVDPAWRSFFESLKDSAPGDLPISENGPQTPRNAPEPDPVSLDSLRAMWLIRTYRIRGHLRAKLDPLDLTPLAPHPEFDPRNYGFTEDDLTKPIFIDGMLGLQMAPLQKIITRLQRVYCGSIGIEYMHIQDPEQRRWIRDCFEKPQKAENFDPAFKSHVLERLTFAESLEKFLQTAFPGTARFSLEGAEALIPALEALIARCAHEGLQKAVIGMAHRGRLNILANLLHKPLPVLFAEFQGTPAYPDSVQGSGDLKYHLGTSTVREFGGHKVRLTLMPNPSHLEFVDPVVMGRVRAKQQQCAQGATLNDEARRQIMGLLIHGDAAFAGQGIAAETLMLSELRGYTTGGTVHVVINNQVGFTTSPKYARSGVYCTDAAKMIQSPVFHVNGDDVEAVIRVAHMAASFRQKFHKDAVIDIVCYRRHGHSENDEPSFTQPLMVEQVRKHVPVREIYAKKLVSEGVLTEAEASNIGSSFQNDFKKSLKESAGLKPDKADWLEGHWLGLASSSSAPENVPTGVDLDVLRDIGRRIGQKPEGFNIHPKIAAFLDARRAAVESGDGIDWATAEALAFGSLMLENIPVRLSGQDCGRGTFAQRHAIIYDQTNEQRYVPLNGIRPMQADFEVHDSPLSEAAVLGFEYGFSLAGPDALVCWEAQFGDFANGAQVIIDQFIASAESKWLRLSGLVLLLPHGYEGQGPEHSSARLERFLQLCGEDNWQVAQCTTPANYFHILRRQVKRSIRKPLALMTPKALLNDKRCVSNMAWMGPDTAFRPVIGDRTAAQAKNHSIKNVILCSGKIYHDLNDARGNKRIDDLALIRLEQFYPFPEKELAQELARFPKAKIAWCQEEPENMGAWNFLDRRLENVLAQTGHKNRRISCIARPESAAPATGSFKKHLEQQQELINRALHGA